MITSGSPVVASVPEPLTILGSGIALGFWMLFRRMKQQ
ncbi:PEP-CTERM sorting domain-containing protein [Coleofasciculus chthonoplastes]